MKRLFTFFISLILCACCLFSFVGCEPQKKVDNDSIVDPRVETVKVGIIEYAPLNYMYRTVFKGFNTELAVMTFNALGYNVEFVLVEPENEDKHIPDANDVYNAFDEGVIDCFWGGISDAILFDESRADFSYPYLENSVCLVKSTYASTISKLSDLEGKKIAFGDNSTGEKYYAEKLKGVISGVSSSCCERGQKSALHKVKSITESEEYAIVDTLMALYHKYNGEFSDVVLTDVDLEQKNYLRVVFKKETGVNELRDNVNAMLETFANLKTDGKSILTKLAEKYKFGSYEKNVSDYIITDFSANNGGESGQGAGGNGMSSNPETELQTPPTTPSSNNGGSNTQDFPGGWMS